MAITFGQSAPSAITINLDALFSQSLANYKAKLHDNIGATNAFLMDVMRAKLYKSNEGGTDQRVPLMYELTPARSYDAYDELATTPMDGVTEAVFEWRQAAVPIVYNMKELIQNKKKILSLTATKLKQSEMGFQEYFAQALMWGNVPNGGNLHDPLEDTVNASLSPSPIPLIIKYDPTTSTEIGNINQSTSTWWRNKTKTSAATTYIAFMLELNNIFNSCALGTGGKPKIVLMDQTTYELFVHAYWATYHHAPNADLNFPFEATVYKGAHIVMDDKVPDPATGVANATTKGTAYLINTEFFSVEYIEGRDFELLRDDNGKAFQKPVNQDARVAHMAWMGQVGVSNRRKQGVFGNIARTLT